MSMKGRRRADPTLKEVPRDFRYWSAEVIGVSRWIDRCAKARGKHGEKWVEAQGRYYTDRLMHLLQHPPRLPTVDEWERIIEANSELFIRLWAPPSD